MMSGVAASGICALLCVFLQCGAQGEKHSLYYIYTSLSRPVDLPGIYEFSAMGLLDDRQIDSYNSKDQRKIPTQQWMKEKMPEDYWEKGTQSRKSKEQWFNVNIGILMDRMRHNASGLHVFQWRHGCEVEVQGSEVKFSKGISEYGYDGEDFLAFDEAESQWVAPVGPALPTKRKWDNVPILNQYTKGYLEKECVDWLNNFREFADEELRNGSLPDVYKLTKKSTKDETKLKLTCLATGFYPKHVKIKITLKSNKLQLFASTGVRPNDEKTFQMRLSVEIHRDEELGYECHVVHANHTYSTTWDGKCTNCSGSGIYFLEEAVVVFTLVLLKVLLWCIFTGSVHKKFNVNQMNSNDLTRKQSITSESAELENSRLWWTFRSRMFCKFSTATALKIHLPNITRFFHENTSRGYKIRI